MCAELAAPGTEFAFARRVAIRMIPKSEGDSMVRFFSTVALATLAVAIAVPVTAQQDKKRASPHEKVMADIDGNKITLEYGRPYAKRAGTDKVRKIWGGL